jgi:hypothetical protein
MASGGYGRAAISSADRLGSTVSFGDRTTSADLVRDMRLDMTAMVRIAPADTHRGTRVLRPSRMDAGISVAILGEGHGG